MPHAMVLRSRHISFNSKSWNIHGEPIEVNCQFSSHLCSEISITPIKGNTLGVGVYYGFVGLLLALITGNIWTWWFSKDIPSLWVTIVMTGCLIPLWLKFSYFNVIKETVIVIKNIGIQIQTIYKSGREAVKFVDHTSIADIIINEAITMADPPVLNSAAAILCLAAQSYIYLTQHKVIFYLAILQKSHQRTKESNLQIIPLFTSVYPRLEAIKPVYHVIRGIVFNENLNQEVILSMDGIKPGHIS